ncbi:hypothetical protein HY636_03530 [Candidatus Woesearchaeota archaeon]|nr:hypothetical protein [Candidatus Woesearchaeota archaeon]
MVAQEIVLTQNPRWLDNRLKGDQEHWLKYIEFIDRAVGAGVRFVVDGPCVSGTEGMWIGGKCGVHGSCNSAFVGMLGIFYDRLLQNGDYKYRRPAFLDLGSGLGQLVFYAERMGFEPFGIELCDKCYTISQENLSLAEQLGIIAQNQVKLARGNFFPNGFTLKKRLEEEGDEFRGILSRHHSECVSNTNPYKELGKEPTDFDVFFHYQVENMKNVLRFFADYARVGAILFFIKTMRDYFTLEDQPKNVIILDKEEEVNLYQKIK